MRPCSCHARLHYSHIVAVRGAVQLPRDDQGCEGWWWQGAAVWLRVGVCRALPACQCVCACVRLQGMRIARSAAEFAETLASCRREAMNSFSDDVVLIEK